MPVLNWYCYDPYLCNKATASCCPVVLCVIHTGRKSSPWWWFVRTLWNLHCIALHCIVLYCIVLHYFTLHCITLHCITFHRGLRSRSYQVCPVKLVATQQGLRNSPKWDYTVKHFFGRQSSGWGQHGFRLELIACSANELSHWILIYHEVNRDVSIEMGHRSCYSTNPHFTNSIMSADN